MCESCFNHWISLHGFPDVTFQDQLQVFAVAIAILRHPDVSTDNHGRYLHAGGGTNIPIQDDQYDLDITDCSVAGMAWNQLPERLRALVVAVVKGYRIPDGRVFHMAADGNVTISSSDGFHTTVNYSVLVPGGPA